MKFKTIIVLGSVLSIFVILFMAYRIENGDVNSISMYLIVFAIPAFVITLIYALFIQLLDRLRILTLKVVLSFLPIAILFIASLTKNITIPYIDGDLSFVAKSEAIALGFTDIAWIIRSLYLKKRL